MMLRSLAQALSPGGARARLTILIFHRVLPLPDPLFPEAWDVRRFEQAMGWVRRWFQVLPLDAAARRLAALTLPARALAITFDDGYADNATQALPVLQALGLPATFFITTGYLDGGRMWNDSVTEALRRTPHTTLDLRHAQLGLHPLRTLAERRSAIGDLLARIKYLPAPQRLEQVAQVTSAAGVPLPSNLMMRSEQVRALHQAGMQIGAHTVSHPILESRTDVQARWELVHSKRVLQEMVQAPVTLFAYPNGGPAIDYSARHVAMVRQAGFEAAVSTAPGAAAPESDLLQLPRFTPWDRGRLAFGLRLVQNLRRRGVVV